MQGKNNCLEMFSCDCLSAGSKAMRAGGKSGRRRIAGIVLAAGTSTRMGCQKLLLPWAQQNTILGTVLDVVITAGLDQILVVSGSDRKEIEEIAHARGISSLVYNPNYLQGQSASLQRGLSALPAHTAAMFILGDQPYITARMLSALAAAYRQQGAKIVAPRTRDGYRGNPVVFSPALFSELFALSGDIGGRNVIETHIDEILYVDVSTDTVFEDLDTMDQYLYARNRQIEKRTMSTAVRVSNKKTLPK